ncbi:ral GTPase-activating protein subunit beta-like [Hydractinia symbiolongicarpus]|uniref:ral GTPase-activating protein subunit beta-like n=1 Tax=Hydractinia symbiolongicarpus TaxID=13093 RepID=UPI0025504B42|nr:ral GTPase-activating protein subunit beta-like [Hydractinia symbiolongicarpus]
MYNGWISNRTSVEDDCGSWSVLNSYPQNVGKDVTSSVIRSLVHHPSEKKDFFRTAKDLDWTMDVICFGLTMPLAEVEMIKNCVFLYLDWTSVMSAKPKSGIPTQIIEKKEYYFGRMLKHLTNLFIPRESASTVLQAKFCSQVLHHIKSIVLEGTIEKLTSEMILKFYLGISSHLLSVPPLQGGLAEHLCEQLINCVITVWLHVSCHYFPSPTLWCTLREIMLTWRHHHILILQWNKLMYVLTCRVLHILFGPNYPLPRLYKDDFSEPILLPNKLSDELAVQCWFRFLHIIGNPVSLSKTNEICGTEYFLQYSLEQRDSHPSLKSLPASFYKAMKGVSVLVGMFLGSSQSADKRSYSISSQSFARGEWKSSSTGTIVDKPQMDPDLSEKSATTPGTRRGLDPSRVTKGVRDDSNLKSKVSLDELSADTNCILHLFGSWLFEVCLSGVNIDQVLQSVGMISCGLRPKSLHLTKEEREQFGSFPGPKKNDFEPGRAQAFSTLCHIFCHQRTTSQAILPVYLSRFYLSLAVGLCYCETRAGQVLGSILLTAKDILRLDLQGVQVLVPHLLQALEIILPTQDRELVLGYDVSLVELRKSCIQILLSMICLPLHFLSLPIQGLCREKAPYGAEGNTGYLPQVTFLSLKERITKLLMHSIEVETNPQNTQMLLGGAMLLMEDTMCVEFKNYEFSKQNPGSAPCILLDDADGRSSSPKLIHIAKTTHPVKQQTNGNNSSQKKTLDKSKIGLLGKKEDILTTKGQFVYMTTLLCQKLMFAGKWRGELHVTLTALECISGMAQLDPKFIDEAAAHKSLVWICDYIEFQARQPPPAHSKDLHSIIIASFSCISAWIVNHPWLMDDQHCLQAVLEVIELGISGSKSRPRSPEYTPALKGDKELMPVSFRVREAAEALLALMMENLGFFPTPCGPASLSSLLDEEQLLNHSEDKEKGKFRYYALDGTVIIALHDDSMKCAMENLPSMMAIMRGPAGKKVCLMQLRHFSRAKEHLSNAYKVQPERPLGLQETPQPPQVSQQCYPPEVNRVEVTQADLSIPQLNSILNEKQKEAHDHMAALMAVQKEQEEKAQQTRKINSFGLGGINADICQKQPSPVDDHRVSRLFLSHMNILQLNNLQLSTTNQHAGLKLLQCSDTTMLSALKKLDCFPTRTFDTMFVVFVKKGQHNAREIMTNKVPSLDNQFFMEFLHSMGWKVDIATHNGWNGNVNTSWRHKAEQETCSKYMFYYSDLLTELAIHVPTLNLHLPKKVEIISEMGNRKTEQIPVFEISKSGRRTSEGDGKPIRKHAHFEQTGSAEVKQRPYNCQSETKVMVAWLQDFSDHFEFPALDLVELNDPQEHSYAAGSSATSRVPEKEVVVIYVHPLKTGLFRIMAKSVFGSTISGPLVDGMVVSRRVLGSVVRNTVINICRRRRLEIDNYSPPHICRKIKIQEIVRKHSQETDVPEFYSSMFR